MAFAKRLNREPVSGQAYSEIKRRILDLTFRPGELLSETRLANDFGLSRTPVREALKRLETDGLVDVVPQQGTFVSPIRRALVRDAQFARSALECALVEDAARLRSDEDVRQLLFNLDGQERAAAAGDFALLYRLDEEMHARLAAAAGRPAIWDLVADIKIHMDRVRKLTLKPDHAPRLIAQHRAIVDAVAARDARGAAAAMADHLAFVIEHFDEFVSDEAAYAS
jgi:DNA-binding GntR family transcriptional regulator